jgi:hypothetical protein
MKMTIKQLLQECKEADDAIDKLGVDFEEEDFSREDMQEGFFVEKEHAETVNNDMDIVAGIALDHLREDSKYYKKLKKMDGDDEGREEEE